MKITCLLISSHQKEGEQQVIKHQIVCVGSHLLNW